MATINIEYALLCHTGNVREKNQDNFWCDNVYLESENDGLSECLYAVKRTKSTSALCVFDGMGGESHGEMAAYIAAKSFDELIAGKSICSPHSFLAESCLEMNSKICDYQNMYNIKRMGTTAAILMYGHDGVYICNVGDSRIYKYRAGSLVQLSHDHVHSVVYEGKKAPLTQCLGIPESEFIIEPYVNKVKHRNKDRYLLCSDGLTDMVSDEDIFGVFNQGMSIQKTAEALMEMALNNGGIDNITVIVCQLRKSRTTANVLQLLRKLPGLRKTSNSIDE